MLIDGPHLQVVPLPPPERQPHEFRRRHVDVGRPRVLVLEDGELEHGREERRGALATVEVDEEGLGVLEEEENSGKDAFLI